MFNIDCLVYICDFHREQAWERWLAKSSNGMTSFKTSALAYMRRIARATTIEYEDRVDRLKSDTQLWSNIAFARWFGNVWLKQHKVS